jgi:hypothetical protein
MAHVKTKRAEAAKSKLKSARETFDKVNAQRERRKSRKEDKEENARLKAAALDKIKKGVKKVADPIIKNLTDDARSQVKQASDYIVKRRTRSRIEDAAAASKVKTANRKLLMGKVDKTTFDQSLGTGKVKPGYTGGVASSAKARAKLAKTVVKGAKRVKKGAQQVAERITGMKVETKPLPVGALGTGKVEPGYTGGRAEFEKGVASSVEAAKFYGRRALKGGKDILKAATGGASLEFAKHEGGALGSKLKALKTDLESKYGERPTDERFRGAVPKVTNKNKGFKEYASSFLSDWRKSALNIGKAHTAYKAGKKQEQPIKRDPKLAAENLRKEKTDAPDSESLYKSPQKGNLVTSPKPATASSKGGKADSPKVPHAPKSALPRKRTKAVDSDKRVLSSFGKAFAAAHWEQGPGGVFDYEGDEKHKKGKYTTDRLDKRDMSKKRRAAQNR